ncbi:hypothetical protein [[Eubacterium] cellulosolvens]
MKSTLSFSYCFLMMGEVIAREERRYFRDFLKKLEEDIKDLEFE